MRFNLYFVCFIVLLAGACLSQNAEDRNSAAAQTDTPILIPTPTPLAASLPVIVDTDMAEDDMRAILYLLKHPGVDVRAVTVVGTGEAHCDAGVKNALGLLALNGRQDIPVSCGRETPLEGEHAFLSLWRQNADKLYGLNLPDGGSASPLRAPELIKSLINNLQEKVNIVATGPLTNIAEALQENPELAENVHGIYVMGGAVKVKGNVGSSGAGIDNQAAEWNIYIDPHAANIVFNSGAPVTLVPLDATAHAPVTLQFYETLQSFHTTPEAGFIYDMLTTNLGMVQMGGAQFWDSLTAAIFTDESLASFEEFEIQVVEEEGQESGSTIVVSGNPRIRVAVSADGQRFEQTLLSILNLPE